MDILNLEIFCLVADQLSMNKVARQLNRVQSNITTRIQALETELGQTLFIRENRQLKLSVHGERFLSYARQILTLNQQAIQSLHNNKPGGTLRIGSMENTLVSRLPYVLPLFHQIYPSVNLDIQTDSSSSLIQQVQQRTLDCAFVALPETLKGKQLIHLKTLQLEGKPVYQEELLVILPENLNEKKRAALSEKSLAVMKYGCTYRALLQEWAASKSHKHEFQIRELPSYHAILAYVSTGQSIGVIPRTTADLLPKPDGIKYQLLKPISTWLIWRSDAATPTFNAFKSMFNTKTSV